MHGKKTLRVPTFTKGLTMRFLNVGNRYLASTTKFVLQYAQERVGNLVYARELISVLCKYRVLIAIVGNVAAAS